MTIIEQLKKELKENPAYRDNLISSIVKFEIDSGYPNSNVRDKISGPLSDLLFMGENFTKKLENGILINFTYNSKIAREFLLSNPSIPDHVWEPQTTKLLLHFSKNAKNVVIAGAYFGDQAILIANNIKSEGGLCHAFEPNKNNSDLIKHNAELNQLQNILVNNFALWNKSGEKLVFEGEDALASTKLADSNYNNALITLSIDDYIEDENISSLDLLMIDVEGSEFKVIEGAQQSIKKHKPVIVFETHSLYDDWSKGLENSPSVTFFKALGYEIFAVREFHQNIDTKQMPIELLSPENTFCETPPHHGFNMLAVPKKELVDNNLFRIVKNLSPKLILTKNSELFFPSKF